MSHPRFQLTFEKLQGTGNDYVLVSGQEHPVCIELGGSISAEISDRHFGIGSDGLIVVGPSERADFRMHMWNSDGSRGALCGNGLRCVAKFVRDSGAIAANSFTIETDVGVHDIEVRLDAEGEVDRARVGIGTIVVERDAVEVEAAGRVWSVIRASAGNPHAVVFIDGDLASFDVDGVGSAFQVHPMFVGGVNVEFVTPRPPDRLLQRTYERGSAETFACGSGATSAACAAIQHGYLRGNRILVELRGGTLVIERDASGFCTLEGPVERAFRGECRVGGRRDGERGIR